MAASVVVPGNHDGVHLGHRSLLAAARARAAQGSLRVVALFFDPHPSAVLAPERAPSALTSASRRVELLRGAGADAVHVQPFDSDFATLSPEAFVQQILVERLGARSLVVGPDFRFGRGRAGDLGTLQALGLEHGFEVIAAPAARFEGAPVSSTRIRHHLGLGEVECASALLERYHDIEGEIVEGDRRGRELGFPTANLRAPRTLLPADGVYAVLARLVDSSEPLRGVANLGQRPTFEAGRSLEVHLLDFDASIYGRVLRVAFVKRLRGERRFDGLEALRAQIAIDREAARGALESIVQERARWL
ncbi:MAG: bifunctional riboflavin kinase/FAD synthetase [Myxococcales bacterium]|nr:bifunctional riboflavin kinase/FAD synthetase [Myxococcales bacterium]